MNILFTKRYADLPVLVGNAVAVERLVQRDATWFDVQNNRVWWDATRKCMVPMTVAPVAQPVTKKVKVAKKKPAPLPVTKREFVYAEGKTTQVVGLNEVIDDLAEKGVTKTFQTICHAGKEMIGNITIVDGKAEWFNHTMKEVLPGIWVVEIPVVKQTKMRQPKVEETTMTSEYVWNDDKSSGGYANVVKEGDVLIAYLEAGSVSRSLTQFVVNRDKDGDLVIDYRKSQERGRYSVLKERKDGTTYIRRYR